MSMETLLECLHAPPEVYRLPRIIAMPVSRRSLLRAWLASPLVTLLDAEQWLWVPKPVVAVPTLQYTPKYYDVTVTLDEINAVTLREIYPPAMDGFFKTDPFLKYFKECYIKPRRPSWERAL